MRKGTQGAGGQPLTMLLHGTTAADVGLASPTTVRARTASTARMMAMSFCMMSTSCGVVEGVRNASAVLKTIAECILQTIVQRIAETFRNIVSIVKELRHKDNQTKLVRERE